MTKQKDTFLASEGDAWYARNAVALGARDWSSDPVTRKLDGLFDGRCARVLEVGCGDGSRLAYLRGARGHSVTGVDPSAKAVESANARGVHALQSTADALDFPEASFDAVIFGFCLYLCDDEDLFLIGQQADRVLANPGWLLILDFDAAAPTYRPYHHVPGLQSRKMDYKQMFLWNPAYTLVGFEKFDHRTQRWTDDPGEWVGLSTLRKKVTRR